MSRETLGPECITKKRAEIFHDLDPFFHMKKPFSVWNSHEIAWILEELYQEVGLLESFLYGTFSYLVLMFLLCTQFKRPFQPFSSVFHCSIELNVSMFLLLLQYFVNPLVHKGPKWRHPRFDFLRPIYSYRFKSSSVFMHACSQHLFETHEVYCRTIIYWFRREASASDVPPQY